MKAFLCTIYFLLCTVFISSSCVLILLVSVGASAKVSLNSSTSSNWTVEDVFLQEVAHSIDEHVSFRNSPPAENQKKDLVNEESSGELHGSFDDSEIPPSVLVSTERLLQPSGFKVTPITDALTGTVDGGSVLEVSPFVHNVALPIEEHIEEKNSSGVSVGGLGPLVADSNVPVLLDQDPGAVPTETSIEQPPLTDIPASEENLTETSDSSVSPPSSPPLEDGKSSEQVALAKEAQDDIPSFSEWAQKQIAEAEKTKSENLTSGANGVASTGANTPRKRRHKNYASPDCGAKVVGANPEAVSPSFVLSNSRDEYILSPCNTKIWFVVELCEPIQPQRIELANYELFSSSPHEFSVFVSDRHPTRDWKLATTFSAKDEKTLQSFQLPLLPHFAKYIKLELHSHFGTEHFCPISMFKVFGASEYEVLEAIDSAGGTHTEEEEDASEGIVNKQAPLVALVDKDSQPTEAIGDQKDDLVEATVDDAQDSKHAMTEGEGKPGQESFMLFGTARDAVMSIVKKAAELVGKRDGNCTQCNNSTESQIDLSSTSCMTPSHLVVCHDCSDPFFNKLYSILSCNMPQLLQLLHTPIVHKVLVSTKVCNVIGLDPSNGIADPLALTKPLVKSKQWKTSPNLRNPTAEFLASAISPETIAALCNLNAIENKKIALNQTMSYSAGCIPENSTIKQTDITETVESSQVANFEDVQVSNVDSKPPDSVLPETISESVANLIKPTKTLQIEQPKDVEDTKSPNAGAPATTTSKLSQAESPSPSSVIHTTTAGSTSTLKEESPPISSEPISSAAKNDNETDSIQPAIAPSTTPDETVSVVSMALENFISELEGNPKMATENPHIGNLQKESVFVRLANRIKALERNMSLSSQYLEELSRRYKKQVEELQKTLIVVQEERKSLAEKETNLLRKIQSLENKVDKLTWAFEEILSERDSYKASLMGHHGLLLFFEVIGLVVVLWMCRWMNSDERINERIRNTETQRQEIQRRRSLDSISSSRSLSKARRRPSEEALRVAGSTHHELLIDNKRKISRNEMRRRKRRRKERQDIALPNGEVVLDQPIGEDVSLGVPSHIVPVEHKKNLEEQKLELRLDLKPIGTYLPPPLSSSKPSRVASFMKTAMWSRKQRQMSCSSQEAVEASPVAGNETPKSQKKAGPLRKIVRKLF